ncbi:MAG: ABC transporter permease [Pleomorphochaeta sp.]
MKKKYLDNRDLYEKIIPIPSLILLFLIFLLPLFSTLSNAFIIDNKFTFRPFIELISDSYTHRILLFTINQAFFSTLLSLIIALPGAYLLVNYQIKGRKLILAICTIPFVLPAILVILGFVTFYGNNGFLNVILMKLFNLENPPLKILYSYKAIIIAHAFYNFPIILVLVTTYWENLDYKLELSSLVFGASKFQTFIHITLPRLIVSIISSSLLVFLFCFTSFSIILVLGGGPKYTTMEVEIYRRARISMDLNSASSYAIISILFCIILLILYNRFQRKATTKENVYKSLYKKEKKPVSKIGLILSIIYTFFVVLFVLSPIISIIIKSFLASNTRSDQSIFTLKWYKQLLGLSSTTGVMKSSFDSIINSLKIALTVAILSTPLSLSLAIASKRDKSRSSLFVELLSMLPLAVSSVIIGLGYYLIAAKIKNSGGLILVILAHLIIVLPFNIRAITPEIRKLPPSLKNSAMTLGASGFRAFLNIEVPLLKSSLISGAIFAFAISMGEVNATLILASSSIVTIPVTMYRLIGSYNFGGACALGTILIIVCSIVFISSEYLKKDNSKYI